MFDFGILGINARNLLYIKEFNPRKGIRLADNKFKTKEFLSQRGVPVPKTFGLIKSRQELFDFDFSDLPNKDFVIKPNKGSKGKGILVTKFLGENNDVVTDESKKSFFRRILDKGFNTKFPNYLYKVGGKTIEDSNFRKYLTDILDAKYSLTSGKDKILIEEKLIPGDSFQSFCRHGLADIRVIVFNLIPIAAMVRVPTELSGGKANLAQGGIGFGIEVGSGRIKTMLYKKKVFTDKFPGEFKDFYNKKIQYWNDILMYSSRIQYFVNLGYLALDWVITKDGPKLLEMNARAGLELQNASLLPLKKRLHKIGDLKISDPEKGVEISKTLFSQARSNLNIVSKIIYLSQKSDIKIAGTDKEIKDIILKVDISKNKNYISENLYGKLGANNIEICLQDSDIVIKDVVCLPSSKIGNYEMILGKNTLTDYYIKPINKVSNSIDIISPGKIFETEIDDLHLIDQKLGVLARELNLSNYFKPTNYLDELDIFIAHKGNYNPIFKYKWPTSEKLALIESNLLGLRERFFGNFRLKSEFANLFDEKVGELLLKLELLKSYKKQDYENIEKYNELLYGKIDPQLLEISCEKVLSKSSNKDEKLGKILDSNESKEFILNYLKEKGLDDVELRFEYTNISRISVLRGKKAQIKFSSNAKFRELELRSVLAHEIDVHLVRYLNGIKTGWEILKSGTKDYLKDEEGLAIYNSMKYLPDGYEKLGMYQKYYLVALSGGKSFKEVFQILKEFSDYSDIGCFKSVLRLKQGIKDTSIKSIGSVYVKPKIYLEGYENILNYVKNGGNPDLLLIGKVKINDLGLFNNNVSK